MSASRVAACALAALVVVVPQIGVGIGTASPSASAEVRATASSAPSTVPPVGTPLSTPVVGINYVVPTRLVDTRDGSGGPYAGDHLAFGGSLTVTLPQIFGAPLGVALSVVALDASSAGYLSVYPGGSPPLASSVNYTAGGPNCSVIDCVASNLVTVMLSGNQFTIFNGPAGPAGSTDVVVDLEATYVINGGPLFPVTSGRLVDTRCSLAPTPPLCPSEHLPSGNVGLSTVPPFGTLDFAVGGQDGINLPGYVLLNVTVTDTRAPGYITGYADDGKRPATSDLDWVAGQTTAELVYVPVGAHGGVDIFNGSSGSVDLVIDAIGYQGYGPTTGSFANGTLNTAYDFGLLAAPVRLVDTRPGSTGPDAGSTLGPLDNLAFSGSVGGLAPMGVGGALLNITDVNASASSYFSVGSTVPSSPPTTSSMNFAAGEVRANTVLAAGTGSADSLDLFNLAGRTNVVVDLDAYIALAAVPVHPPLP